jgi:hypothetical protein
MDYREQNLPNGEWAWLCDRWLVLAVELSIASCRPTPVHALIMCEQLPVFCLMQFFFYQRYFGCGDRLLPASFQQQQHQEGISNGNVAAALKGIVS